MQEVDPPRVKGPDVEDTDAPVMTSGIAAAAVTHATRSVDEVVAAAFDAHAGHLKAFAIAAVRDDAAADDLVQETFLRLVREVQAKRIPDNIPAWLHRVCTNLVISRGRRQTVAGRKQALLVDRSIGSSPEDLVIRVDDDVRLRDAFAELPSDARAALLMAAAGFSMAEIGEAIGRSTNATSTYVCRARIRLRELLAADTGVQR